MTIEHFTKTETARRIREAAALARAVDYLPKNARIEVGTRTAPVYSIGGPPVEAFDDDDDLDQCMAVRYATTDEQVTRKGYVAHLYFSSTGSWAELITTITVWLGDDDHGPKLLHVPGRRLDA